MSLQPQFQQAFATLLSQAGEEIIFTSLGFATDSATCQGMVERLGPDNESYNQRVGTRYAVEVLAADLVSDLTETLLVPEERDQISFNDLTMRVVEVNLDWGVYRLVSELAGRPVPR